MHEALGQKYTFLCECTAIEMSKRREGGASLDRITRDMEEKHWKWGHRYLWYLEDM